MSVTKYVIAEQVLFKLYGGAPDTNSPVQPEDIYKATEQKINSLFKLHHLDTTLPSGETIPENTMIATYENVAVTQFGEKSKSTLPVTPISLPKNIGIYAIYDPKYPDMPFVPLLRGQGALLKVDSLLNDLGGMIAYEPKNNEVIYNRNLNLLGKTSVTVELCVFDMSKYGDTDNLPVPADMEERIVNELYAMFSTVQPETGQVNPWTTIAQQPTKQ